MSADLNIALLCVIKLQRLDSHFLRWLQVRTQDATFCNLRAIRAIRAIRQDRLHSTCAARYASSTEEDLVTMGSHKHI